MDAKKETFIAQYLSQFGNVSGACKSIGISRGTFYNWKRDDKEFAQALEDSQPVEHFLDFVENKLVTLINELNPTAIIFALKTKGKHRGYVEKQIIENSQNMKMYGVETPTEEV